MPAEIESQRIPIDHRLYNAARDGNINLLENLLAEEQQQLRQLLAEGEQQVQPAEQLARLVTDGGDQVLGRPFKCLLGVTYSGDTALHIAAYFGHFQVAMKILDGNRSLLLRENNKLETPLHYAAQSGKHELVAQFIRVAQTEPQIVYIVKSECVNVVTELLRWRNQDGETALYQAVHNKHSSVVRTLINADPHLASIPDNKNVSPLYLAAMRNLPGISGYLIESLQDNAPQKAYAGPDGQTALHAAALRVPDKGMCTSTVEIILKWKPDMTKAKDDTGSTPLHYASSANNVDAVELLLKSDKAAAYIADSCGLFPIHIAVKLGHLEVVTMLFKLCPDSDELLDTEGRTFLHIAVEKRKVFVVLWARKNYNRLVRAINAKDNEGNTVMHLAVKARDLLIFALILESKWVDMDITNRKGLTPLNLAVAQRKTGINHWQNRDYIIYRTLMGKSHQGIRRRDHFLTEYKMERDQEKIEREANNIENMAKNTSTVSVLIASASFAGIFSVSGAYKADIHEGNQSSGLNLAFKAFIITVAFAFICSITATGLFMFAAMIHIDPMYCSKNLVICINLVNRATQGLLTAFSLGAYVMLAPVSKWLAILICLTGVVVPVLINPMERPNIMIYWALLRSIGLKELWRIIRMFDQELPCEIEIPWI